MDSACAFCENRPQYLDRETGQLVCLAHTRLEMTAAGWRSPAPPLAVRPAQWEDRARLGDLMLYFWDETEVDCFDCQYEVLDCPAHVVCDGDEIVGAAAYAVAPEWDAVVLVVLHVLPRFQGRGGGRSLLDAVRDEAARRGLGRVLVATSNDDLPALALYQRYGFRIVEVVAGRIADDHGGAFPGFAGIMVRDEIRLEYQIERQGVPDKEKS